MSVTPGGNASDPLAVGSMRRSAERNGVRTTPLGNNEGERPRAGPTTFD